MKALKLWIFVAAVAAILVGLLTTRRPLQASAAGASISKKLALETIASRVLLPGYADLAARCAQLAATADALTSAPTAASLTRAQTAWREALLAWRRVQGFAHGPIADLNLYSRIQFWPSRRQSVDRVLRAQRPFDDDYIQELGANSVGLSAIEVMLFDARRDDKARLASFTGPQGERQRQYLRALTRELAAKTKLVAGGWQGPSGYAVTFAAAGQESVNLLVNDLLAAIETGVQIRLQIIVDQQRASDVRPDLIEGSLSATSQQGILALLTGAQAALSAGEGPGLDDYLTQLKPPVARRFDAQFQKALAAVRAIDGPLERAVAARPEAVARAQEECHTLEIMLKTEVVSALGVTLTFNATDGD